MISKEVKEFLIMLLTIGLILVVVFTVMNLVNSTKSEFQQKVDSALDAIKDTKKDTVITIKSGTTKMVIKVKK
jgi:hypothetical protein